MSWGYKIIIVYGAFITGIMLLVFKSSSQKMDLVTTDYYAKELVYQQKIDEKNRVDSLKGDVLCVMNDNNDLVITFPGDFSGKKLSGQAILYCPSDESKDVTQNFETCENRLKIPVKTVKNIQLHLSWKADGISYYMEKKIKRPGV